MIYNVLKRLVFMLYKNTFKLLFSNAHLIWKILLYILIAGLVVGGLCLVTALPVVQVLINANFFEKITDVYQTFISSLDLKSLIMRIGDLSVKFVDIINSNISKIMLSIFGVGFVIMVLGTIVFKFYQMPTAVNLYYYMSSNTKHNYANSFASSFKKNFLYQIASFMFLVPINFGIYYLLLYSFRLFRLGGAFIVLSPFIILFGFCILMSLKYTLFCGWIPSIVVRNKGIFSGLKDSMIIVKRRFGQTFGNAFAIVLTSVFLNVFGGVFTYGVGLIVTVPVSLLMHSTFGMVAYYSATGQRYYLDPYNVMAPKPVQYTDKLHNQKYIV